MNQSFASLIVPELPSGELLSARVLKIFDGDGLLGSIRNPVTERDMQVSLRFGFIDAPEMGQYGGQEAKDFLTSLIGGKWIEITVLTKMDIGGVTDRPGADRLRPLPDAHARPRGGCPCAGGEVVG